MVVFRPSRRKLRTTAHLSFLFFFLCHTLYLTLCCFLGVTKLEVSNQGRFVILEVDGSGGLVVGIQSKPGEMAISGLLRLALGGIQIAKERMIVQVRCVYLHLSITMLPEVSSEQTNYYFNFVLVTQEH